MTTHTQSSNLSSTWAINTSNDVWTLTATAQITTGATDAVFEDSSFSGNTVVINGDVTSDWTSVIEILGSNTTLQIGANATASGGNVAAYMAGAGYSLINDGSLIGELTGAYLYHGGTVDNQGLISGVNGIYCDIGAMTLSNAGHITGTTYGISVKAADGSEITNQLGGKITGPTALLFQQTGNVEVTNNGLISGQTAISGDDTSTLTIVNHGTIKGDIVLGSGDDSFDTRGGLLHGTVSGGAGSDTYLVSDASISISEAINGGTADIVKSAVSYVLGDNIENLTLLGGKSIDATGNGLDNTIVDNKGDNVLKGMGGTDILIAGVGNDTMTGGSGTDFFEFNKGTHHDIITDFKNGKDVISSSFVSSDADAAALLSHHAHQDGNDVLISFGHDSVLIKHMDLSALDSADFFYF